MSNPDPIENTVEYNKRNLRHFISGLELLRRQAEDEYHYGVDESNKALESVNADWESLVDTIIYNLSHSGHQSLAAIMDEWLSNNISISLGEKLEPLGNCTEVPFPHGHNDSMGG